MVLTAFLLMGVLARLVPHAPNVTPVTAIALFGATCLSRRWSLILPLGILVISDLALGLHELIAFTWGSVLLIGLIGWWLRRRPSPGRTAMASVAGSTIFFLVTNVGVWWLGDGGTMYPRTASGLLQCYAAALPFYRNGLIGDLLYTGAFFSLYALATRRTHAAAVSTTR